MAVNIPNSRPSNTRNIRNIVVAGGDTPEQPATKDNLGKAVIAKASYSSYHFSLEERKSAIRFPIRSNTNHPAQLPQLARHFEFQI